MDRRSAAEGCGHKVKSGSRQQRELAYSRLGAQTIERPGRGLPGIKVRIGNSLKS